MDLPVFLRGSFGPSLPAFSSVCGDECLFIDADLSAIIPPGVGEITGTPTIFLRKDGRIAKKHPSSRRSFWMRLLDEAGLNLGSEPIPAGSWSSWAPALVAPCGECACGLALPRIEGPLLAMPGAGHYRRLAARFALLPTARAAEVPGILSAAWKGLGPLHARGMGHGDPVHYNILANDEGPRWIDIDSVCSGPAMAALDGAVFIAHSIAPLVRGADAVSLCDEVMASLPPSSHRWVERMLQTLLLHTAAEHHAQREELQSLRTRLKSVDLFSQDLTWHWLSLPADHEAPFHSRASDTAAIAAIADEAAARAALIERLDADLKEANADRAAQAVSISDIRQEAEIREKLIQGEIRKMRELWELDKRELDIRNALIHRLDQDLKAANEQRACQTERKAVSVDQEQGSAPQHPVVKEEDRSRLLEMSALVKRQDEELRDLRREHEELASRSGEWLSQRNTIESEATVRAELIGTLDAHLREANADRIERGMVIASQQARIAELEKHSSHLGEITADMAQTSASAQEKSAMLQGVADERKELIDRLDLWAREAVKSRDDALAALQTATNALASESVRMEHSRRLVESLTDQAVEAGGAAAAAKERAEAAEKEAELRLIVINELDRSRDLILSRLGNGRPAWWSRLKTLLQRGGR